MSEDIPLWAFDAAMARAQLFNSRATYRRNRDMAWAKAIDAFARYIATHEEAPVDPDHALAVELVLAEAITRTEHQNAAIRNGQAGQDKVRLALAAIKRGRELEASK